MIADDVVFLAVGMVFGFMIAQIQIAILELRTARKLIANLSRKLV